MAVKLENKQTKIKLTNDETDSKVLDYFTLILSVISRQAVSTAWTVDELKNRLDLIEILESNLEAESVSITDANSELLKKEIAEAKWTLAHRDIIEFVDYILKLA